MHHFLRGDDCTHFLVGNELRAIFCLMLQVHVVDFYITNAINTYNFHRFFFSQEPVVTTEPAASSNEPVMIKPAPSEASNTAIILPPPDEKTALNQGDKKTYTPGN